MILLTPSELRAALKISRATYTRLVAAHQLPHRLVGTQRRFVLEEVVAALPHPQPRPAVGPRISHDLTTILKARASAWGQRRVAHDHAR